MSERIDHIRDMIEDALAETGLRLERASREVATYIASQAAGLADAADEQGFHDAVRSSRNNIWHFAAGRGLDEAAAADQRIVGLIQGILLTLAKGALL